MSVQSPNVPTLEPVYLVEATYVANAAEARAPFRPAHLARLTELKGSGVVVEAGAYADASASLLMLRAATENEAVALPFRPLEQDGLPASTLANANGGQLDGANAVPTAVP